MATRKSRSISISSATSSRCPSPKGDEQMAIDQRDRTDGDVQEGNSPTPKGDMPLRPTGQDPAICDQSQMSTQYAMPSSTTQEAMARVTEPPREDKLSTANPTDLFQQLAQLIQQQLKPMQD